MTNILQYAARQRQAEVLQAPELRLSECGTSVEMTLRDGEGNIAAILEFVLREKVPQDFDLARLCALWDILRDNSSVAS